MGESGEKEVRAGDEKLDVGKVVSAGGWEMRRVRHQSFSTRYLTKWLGSREVGEWEDRI